VGVTEISSMHSFKLQALPRTFQFKTVLTASKNCTEVCKIHGIINVHMGSKWNGVGVSGRREFQSNDDINNQ
jgi:hypothetical protein